MKHQRELKDCTFKPQIKAPPKQIQSRLQPYSHARQSRIADQKKQELKWRTQSLATLPELGKGLETPVPAAKTQRRANKSMVVNDPEDDDDIERAAGEASHSRYIQSYI